MIELTEEVYDSEVATPLVQALNIEINERYATDEPDEPADGEDADRENYEAEVTPALVRRPVGVFLVAWLDAQPVGCGAIKPFEGSSATAEVKRMFTNPLARRHGVARAVLRRLEELAVELGYERLLLETGTMQPEALALYASSGWQRIEPYGFYKDSELSVCFAKELVAR
ncbi:MAG: GNAT family N-acetyltransferase [Microthrixaceae bacterium]